MLPCFLDQRSGIAFAAASQDIAVDAYAVESQARAAKAQANTIPPKDRSRYLIGTPMLADYLEQGLDDRLLHLQVLEPGMRGNGVRLEGRGLEQLIEDRSALVPVAEPAYPEPPAGVHMPGPSPWPFFAPIALTVMLLGLIFSPVLLVGGLILGIIAQIGVSGGTRHVIEYRGQAIRDLTMEQRMTICNMSIEGGARAGMIAPDETTFAYLKGRPYVDTTDFDATADRRRSGSTCRHGPG